MTKDKYTEYLQSDHWKKIRMKRMEVDHFKCVCCGTMNELQVHHITYDNVGHEDVYGDLITLCKDCHKKLHTILDGEKEFIEQENERFSKEYEDCFLPFKTAFKRAVKLPEIEHNRRIERKSGHIMHELLRGKTLRPGCSEKVERMLKRTLDKFDGMTVNFYPTFYPELPTALTLYRTLKGKKKYGGSIDSVDEWEAAYENIKSRVDESLDEPVDERSNAR